MMRKVWAIGDAVVDLLPETSETLRQCPGGAPANVSVGISRLGGCSGFIGTVGSDTFGNFLHKTLSDEGVDVSHFTQLSTHMTSTVLVSLDESGERDFAFLVKPSADLFLTTEKLPIFEQGQLLHLCSISLSREPSRSTVYEAIKKVKKAGGWVSFDPNIREDLWANGDDMIAEVNTCLSLADIIKLSQEELFLLTSTDDLDKGIQTFLNRFSPGLLAVTLGASGVIIASRGQVMHYPVTVVKVVDTTGAGDAFVAGLLWGVAMEINPLNPLDLEKIVLVAQRCGALATTAMGAMNALPKLEAVLSPA